MNTFIVLCILALLVRVGFALYADGLTRAKNSATTVFRTIAELCFSVLAFWAVGAAILLQSHNRWFSFDRILLFGYGIHQGGGQFLIFGRLVMILTASCIVGGAVAERSKFLPVCIASFILAGFVLPVTAHAIWPVSEIESHNGWLWHLKFIDNGGGAALHLAAGVFAWVAAVKVGPRTGKFNRDGSSSNIPGHNVPVASVGLVLIWVGWIAYVAAASILPIIFDLIKLKQEPSQYIGFVIGDAAMNVLLAASVAGVASIFYSQIRFGKPDIILTLAAMIGGMVSMCAGGAELLSWSAAIIGAVAGILVPMAIVALDFRARLDDPLGVIAIHTVGGAWGTLAAGLFIPMATISPMGTRGRGEQILVQVVGILGIALFSALVAILVFTLLQLLTPLRLKEADEFDGLDLAEHDIGAYPDFQQTSIKSYHLREV